MANADVIERGDFPSAQQPKYDRDKARRSRYGDLVKFMEADNICDLLDDDELGRIGQVVDREYEVDKNSRSDWEERNDKAMKLALQEAEQKNFPWPKASNVKYPLITTAAIQFAARAYPAIVNERDVVKGQVRGHDGGIPKIDQQTGEPVINQETGEPQWQVEPGAKRKRADRVARHMSWQLTEEMDEWEEDTDRLLHVLPIVGCAFRKTWFDPSLGRNRSELVMAQSCVVNANARSMDTAPRVTQAFELYPFEIVERERMGIYRELDYGPVGEANDDDAPHEFLEQHRTLDLDDDGYAEPYIVTLHKDTSRVVRIVARYDEDDVLLNDKGEVAKIEPKQFWTKYSFIPSPDGKFYDVGFGILLEPLNNAVNSTLNQMIDAGTLQNTGGGFIGSGLRIKGGVARFQPGEYKRVDVTGGNIKDNVVPLDHPGPNATLFNLLGLLIEAGRDISSVKDVMTGDEGPQNEAATRMMARIEQGMKVFSAIYKRVFRALKSEYKKLYDLNAEYLEPEVYFTLHDEPEAVAQQDYARGDLDVVPVADPAMISDQQRLAKAEFLMQFLQDPYMDGQEIRRRIMEAGQIPDYEDVLVNQPAPDPTVAAKADELEIEKRKSDIDAFKAETERNKALAEVAKLKSDVILNLAKAEHESDKAEIEALSTLLDSIINQRKLDVDRETKERDIEQRDRSDERRVRGMAGQSGNAGGQ